MHQSTIRRYNSAEMQIKTPNVELHQCCIVQLGWPMEREKNTTTGKTSFFALILKHHTLAWPVMIIILVQL
jgi:hypothetical protein